MIPTWLQTFASGRAVVVALTLWLGFAAMFFAFGPYSTLRGVGGGDLLEERFGYSATEAQEWLRLLGEDRRDTYRGFQLLDGLNAAFMTVALTLSLTFTLSRLLGARNVFRLLIYLPVFAGVSELLENSLLLSMLSTFPSVASTARFAGPITGVKFVLGFSAMPITMISFLCLGAKALRDRARASRA